MLCTGNAQLLEAAVACDEVFPARGRPGCAVTPEFCQWFLGGPQLDWVVFSFFLHWDWDSLESVLFVHIVKTVEVQFSSVHSCKHVYKPICKQYPNYTNRSEIHFFTTPGRKYNTREKNRTEPDIMQPSCPPLRH